MMGNPSVHLLNIQRLLLSFLLISNSLFASPNNHSLEQPILIKAQILVIDIDNISTPDQNFTANIYGAFRWLDKKLQHQDSKNKIMPLTDIWNPRLQIVNRQLIWSTLPNIVEVTPEGEVILRQRVWGNFSQPFNLKKFPFDTQTLNVIVVTPDFTSHQIIFSSDEKHPSGLARQFSQPDWQILSWELKSGDYQPMDNIIPAPSIQMSIKIKRHVSYYIYKFIIPLLFIVGMSYTIFWLDPKESSTRVGLAATAMLTLIAYRFMIATDLPKVPYLTRMDIFILYSTALVFCVLIISAYLSTLIKSKKLKKVEQFDKFAHWFFPLLVLIGIVLPFIIY